MAKRIFKYVIDDFVCQLRMPKGAQVLSAHAQNEQVCVWALVDPEADATEIRTFRVYPTGAAVHNSEALTFIGTVLTLEGRIVQHVFEVTNERTISHFPGECGTL